MITETEIDQQIITQIRLGHQKTLAQIYKEVYPMVLKFITSKNGSVEDAQDIFQDAFYILIKKTESSDFVLTSQLSTFLVGISKNLWLKKVTTKSIDLSVYHNEELFNADDSDETDTLQLEKTKRMATAISELGEPCKTLLVQYYYFKQTMKEIAALLHYTNAENAKNQKYKCLQRLKRLVTKSND